MKRLKIYEAEDRMMELIRDNYSVLQGLGAFGIRLGFGDKTVQQVCEAQEVDTYTFLAVVNFLINGTRPVVGDQKLAVPTLLTYLKESHNYFVEFQLPSIRKELEEALAQDNSLSGFILQLYDAYAHSIRLHMKYEEKTLFPYVEALLQGEQVSDYNVEVFSRHHKDTTGKLQELKHILIKYLPADGLANNQLMGTLYSLYNHEEWLTNHSRVEDEIFIPSIRQLEQKNRATDVSARLSGMIGNAEQQETLSQREKDIIICLVQGMSNKEIAQHLYISVHTVITHRRNIVRKLQIHSLAGLTIYAIVNNLIELK